MKKIDLNKMTTEDLEDFMMACQEVLESRAKRSRDLKREIQDILDDGFEITIKVEYEDPNVGLYSEDEIKIFNGNRITVEIS